jgi:hypothetical protein
MIDLELIFAARIGSDDGIAHASANQRTPPRIVGRVGAVGTVLPRGGEPW